jgi:hypothetical protein
MYILCQCGYTWYILGYTMYIHDIGYTMYVAGRAVRPPEPSVRPRLPSHGPFPDK